MTYPELAVSIISGIFSSLVASFVFLRCILLVKPKICISPYISREITTDGSKKFYIKILNLTKNEIINVRCHLSLVTVENIPGGTRRIYKTIPIARDNIFSIPKYDINDSDALYEKLFRCSGDLNEIWSNNLQYLQFRVIANHSVSGFSKVFVQNFYNKQLHLKDGNHDFGSSLEVV